MLCVLAPDLTGSVAYIMIVAIVVAAVVGIGLVAIRASGVAIPAWVIQIFWILVIAIVAILAIKFLLSVT